LIISASAGGYVTTNFYIDDSSIGYTNYLPGLIAKTNVLEAGAAATAITYIDENPDNLLSAQITSGSNLVGYMSWGYHSQLPGGYATNGDIIWSGNGVASASVRELPPVVRLGLLANESHPPLDSLQDFIRRSPGTAPPA
jgi:hypothetical protein